MFEGDNALKKIAVLSGGEKCRVLLAKILVNPCNFLLLDEPTNHLDMDSCNSFLKAINSFKGTVILVTHNEFFLKKLASKLIVFKDNSSTFFDGDYNDFIKKIGWDENIELKNKPSKNNKKEKAELIQSRSRTINPLQKKISNIENEITKLENNLKINNNDILTASINKNSILLKNLSIKNKQDSLKLENLYNELDQVLKLYDKIIKDYETEFEKLNKKQL